MSETDQARLGRHYKSFSAGKASSFSDDERAEIASIYEMMRDEYGFYPTGLDTADRIIWGIALKSDLQILADKRGEEYERRGKEVMEERGGFGLAMEERRIKE